jgi:hypothetical protein
MRFLFRCAVVELRNTAQPTVAVLITRAGHVTIFCIPDVLIDTFAFSLFPLTTRRLCRSILKLYLISSSMHTGRQVNRRFQLTPSKPSSDL